MSKPVLPSYLQYHIPSASPFALERNITLQCQLIGEIKAEEIEALGLFIATTIGKTLGVKQKQMILESIIRKSMVPMDTPEQILEGGFQRIRTLDEVLKARLEMEWSYFSGDQLEKFSSVLNESIKKAITAAFSCPENFIKKGLEFEISEELFQQVSTRTRMDFSSRVVPSQYEIHLKFNPWKTQEKLHLVFQLELFSQEIPFLGEEYGIEYLKWRRFQ